MCSTSEIILDTSVVVDIFVPSRPRHTSAQRLARYLQAKDQWVKLPFSAIFELACAVRNVKMSNPGDFMIGGLFTAQTPLKINSVDINQDFFDRYFSLDLPYMKAGDLIFVAMAKADSAILITEDETQYKKAQEAGVQVFRIKEFLDSIGE